MKKFYVIILLLFVYRFCFSITNVYNRIIYLSDSTLFIYDLNTNSSVQLSIENDKINDFIVSPDFKYLAYSIVIGNHECVGGFSEDTASIPISSEFPYYSVKIFDFGTNILLNEIHPLSNEFISLNKWVSPQEFLCDYGDCEVFDGWIKYTVNDSLQRFPEYDDANDFNSIIGVSKDGEYRFYADSSKVLHKYNFLSKTDLKLPNAKNIIMDCEQSYNKKFIAWLEVADKTNKYIISGSVSNTSIEKVILLSVLDWKKKEIFSDNVSEITSRKYLTFSPNDSLLSIETAKEIVIKNIYSGEKSIVYGHNLGWISTGTFIYSNLGCIFVYDMKLKKSKLIISNSNLAYTIR